jgi:hypothetical protein
MNRRALMIFVGFLTLIAVVVVVAVGVSRWLRGGPAAEAVVTPASSSSGPRIKARLFYVADDGTRLTSVERDVAYGEGAVEQARQIIQAQIAPVAEPLVSAVPPATRLRAIFITEQGEAFVDFTRDLAAGHTGGSTDEALTVYTIVNALTANLPAINSVQLLVEGKQIETLAGHVDLRRPLDKNGAWIQP